MELVLTKNEQNQVTVTCDGQFSHMFLLTGLLPDQEGGLIDPVETGKRLFAALFAHDSITHAAWDAHPKRILLVTEDSTLDSIPWEYLHGSKGFVVLDVAFVRGLLPDQRRSAPDLTDIPLHVVSILSNPIDHKIAPIDSEGEWIRLKQSLSAQESAITLERVRPPTLEQTRNLTAHQRHRVFHFIGHAGRDYRAESFLLFENDFGVPKAVTAQDFIRSVEDTAFLVLLNIHFHDAPGETEFVNMARTLSEHGLPYVMEMRFSIPVVSANAFLQTFYGELAHGSSVESALLQARKNLMANADHRVVGALVMYTSLQDAAQGFVSPFGTPRILEHQPPMDLFALPQAVETFQGRVDELLTLGQTLTGELRARLLTIHGVGGQGKTALAHEAAERFAHAWDGGVLAVSLETKPNRASFAFQLGQFLSLSADQFSQQAELEQAILIQLNQQRSLLVLDNAETFTEAIRSGDAEALDLAEFLRNMLSGTQISLLVTSREPLGWPVERVLPLEGLSQTEGAALFITSAPKRQSDIQMTQAEALSTYMDGHPLALLLLSLAFNASDISLEQFIAAYKTHLLQAKNDYADEDHRHRTLYTSIETSIRYLDESHKSLLSSLWIFQSPFMPETVAKILALPSLSEKEASVQRGKIYKQLDTLHRRGLLVQERETLSGSSMLLYRMLPSVRLFARNYLDQVLPVEIVQERLAVAYAKLIGNIYGQINRAAWAARLIQRSRVDFEACAAWLVESERGRYFNMLGSVLQHIGDHQAGLMWLESALELVQGKDQDRELELSILNGIAGIYSETGYPEQALELYQKALPIRREMGDRFGEAATLNNIALVYSNTGQPWLALELYQQVLPIAREAGNRDLEATILSNMGGAYRDIGQPKVALELLEQVLPIRRETGNRTSEAATLTNMALVYRSMGQSGLGLELLEQALPIRREIGDRSGEATTLSNMALMYRDIGQPGPALELFQQALPIRHEVGDRPGVAATLNNMALVYLDTKQLEQALDLFQQALPLMHKVGNHAGEAITLNNMAVVYINTGQPKQALELLEQALPIHRKVSNRADEANTLTNMARVYSDLGQPQRALELYQQALQIRREVGNPVEEANILSKIAFICSNSNQPEQALESYRQALYIQREVGNRAEEGAISNNMAVIHNAIGQPGQALELYEQALLIHREIGNRAEEAKTLTNMAAVYINTSQSVQALEFYKQALSIQREVENHALEATILNNMALIYRNTSQPGWALELYRQALSIRRKIGNRADEAITLNDMAVVYINIGQPEQSLDLLKQALSIRREVGNRAGEAATCFNMAIARRNMGQFEQAIELLRQSVELKKQIQHPDYSKHTAMFSEWELTFAQSKLKAKFGILYSLFNFFRKGR